MSKFTTSIQGKFSEKTGIPEGLFKFKGIIFVPSDFPTLAEVQIGWFYIIGANVTDNDPTKTNTGQIFLAGDEIVWNGTNWTLLGATTLWGDDLIDLLPINPRNINIPAGQIYKINNENIFTRNNPELNTFDKSVFGSINEINAYQNKIDKDIAYFLNSPATQTLTTTGAGDLATKIGTLVDGDILEIQVDASYSQITIPSGKRFAIRVKKGFHVQLNTAQAITLNNGAANIFLNGFIFDSNPGGDANNRGSAVCYQHQAQVQDITFHNCTFRNNADSAVLLSYHQSTGGDTYYTANLLSEFSDRMAFTDCHFFSAANDPNEGGAITARGINFFYIKDCSYNGRDLARQIHLQNCIDSFIVNTEVQRGGGGGNGEGIKIDKIGSPTYRNSAFVKNCIVKDCIEGFDIDDSADVVIIDSIAHGCSAEGISVDDTGRATIINCITFNNADGIRQETGGIIELKGCNSFNNTNLDYRMDGGYVPDASNISDPDQTFFNWVNFPIIQKEPTGFTEPENIIITYDSSARTITLTGTVNGYYHGKRITALTTGWVSPVHSAVNGKYWLAYNDSGFQWVADGSQKLYDLLIAFANYGISDKWGQRECHGLQPWQSHEEDHDTIGTYRTSGGTLGAYVLNSTTVADRQPSISAAGIKDEDLPTTNPALTASGNYTQFYLSSTDTANFNKIATDIVPLSGNQPYWNQFTGGIWQQTLMSNNYYMSIWLVAIPTSIDSGSQSYRFLWVQGQNESLTQLEQQGLDPNDVNLGELTTLTPEFVFLTQVIIRYQAANWTFSEVRTIQGTKFSQTSSPQGNFLSVVTSDASLTGLGTVSSPLSVVGGSEDLWHRDTSGTPFLRPENIGDDVDLGTGNLSASNVISKALLLTPQLTPPATSDGTIYYNNILSSIHFMNFRIQGRNVQMVSLGPSRYGLTDGVNALDIQAPLTITASCTLDQDLSSINPAGSSWKKISLTDITPTNGLAVNLSTPSLTNATGIGIDIYNKFIYLNNAGTALSSAADIELMIDADNDSAISEFRIKKDDVSYGGGGTLLFKLTEAGVLTIPSLNTANGLLKTDGSGNFSNSTTLLTEPGANQFILTKGTSSLDIQDDLLVTATCTLDQNLISSGNPDWNTLFLTNTTPALGLAVSLAIPVATYETGIGVNLGNKLIYNNPGGMGIYSSHEIMLMLDSNNTSSNAALRIRKDSYSYTGGTELFTFLETGRVGINEVNPAAMLHIDQSSTTAAIPVLTLDQADTSEPVLNFIAQDKGAVPTSTVDSIRSIRVIHNGVNIGVLAIHANQGPA